MRRYLEGPIKKDLKEKIVILSGPRQVGKTTLSRQLYPSHAYLNYDSSSDRRVIRNEEWPRDVEVIVFDELHKMKTWKSWIKGVYDTQGIPPSLLVTGSARLETSRKGGDSLAGRFFSFRLHPLTVKEICAFLGESPNDALDGLVRFSGFPEPYLKKSEAFAPRWRRTHIDTIVRGDLLDLERVREVKSVEILIDLLRTRVGSSTSYSSLAEDLQVSIHTVKHWLEILENLYVVFPVRPYHKNIARSILKEPKYYFYDTGAVEGDLGAKLENVVALALWRELHWLEDTAGHRVALHYLRDKEKREVDFLVLIDNKPSLMIEVKAGDDSFSKALLRFHGFLKEAEPIQLVHDLRRKKSTSQVKMLPLAEFLAEIDMGKYVPKKP
jgi:predicted AAA+ superfamily ATPase